MYKLIKPILITPDIYNTISALKNKMLLTSGTGLIIIKDFKTETIKKDNKVKHLFRSPTYVTSIELYITDIELRGYNSQLEYWGTYTTDDSLHFLFDYFDFSKMRSDYVRKIRRPLEKLGIDFTIKEEAMKK